MRVNLTSAHTLSCYTVCQVCSRSILFAAVSCLLQLHRSLCDVASACSQHLLIIQRATETVAHVFDDDGSAAFQMPLSVPSMLTLVSSSAAQAECVNLTEMCLI